MFERFTDKARRVIVHAQDEAREHDHNYIGTEHLLLGILRLNAGVAMRTITALGADAAELRVSVDEIIGHGQQVPSGHIPFTPRAKKVLELSLRESLQLGHNYIGTEHLLLGLVRERDGVAGQVLAAHRLSYSRVRQQIAQQLHESEAGIADPGPVLAQTYRTHDLPARLDAILARLSRIEERLSRDSALPPLRRSAVTRAAPRTAVGCRRAARACRFPRSRPP